ncbi:MAG: hypothetical protein EBR92_06165, partial [Alphaproteobacteria bacterium]|nr:hypothetical protein [Alphaproteobacteria bacterium]
PAINLVIDDALEGGVNSSLNQDLHGKTLSFLLLGELFVEVPADLIPNRQLQKSTPPPASPWPVNHT